MKVRLDEGVSTIEFKLTHLIKQKADLVEKILKVRYKTDLEKLDHKTIIYMRERLEGTLKYERTIMSEMDPYFNFQIKIQTQLSEIKTGKE